MALLALVARERLYFVVVTNVLLSGSYVQLNINLADRGSAAGAGARRRLLPHPWL